MPIVQRQRYQRLTGTFHIPSLGKIFILIVLLFATGTGAQEPSTKGTVTTSTGELKKWIGTYDPLSRACERDTLIIEKAMFTWMDCRGVKFSEIVNSERELAFRVDPNSSCGWTAKVISLTSHAPKAPLAISVRAYKDVATFKNDTDKKHYLLYCSYARRQ
jgi:hypothetical protein